MTLLKKKSGDENRKAALGELGHDLANLDTKGRNFLSPSATDGFLNVAQDFQNTQDVLKRMYESQKTAQVLIYPLRTRITQLAFEAVALQNLKHGQRSIKSSAVIGALKLPASSETIEQLVDAIDRKTKEIYTHMKDTVEEHKKGLLRQQLKELQTFKNQFHPGTSGELLSDVGYLNITVTNDPEAVISVDGIAVGQGELIGHPVNPDVPHQVRIFPGPGNISYFRPVEELNLRVRNTALLTKTYVLPPGKGYIRLVGKVDGAQVSIDGQPVDFVAHKSVEIELRSGRRTLEVWGRRGFMRQVVDVWNGLEREVSVNLRPANPHSTGKTFSDRQDTPLMVTVPAGTTKTVSGNRTIRSRKPFAASVHEISNTAYARFLNSAAPNKQILSNWIGLGSRYRGQGISSNGEGYTVARGEGRRPVRYVSWDGARAYARWLSQRTGHQYRLPRDEEWEYLARGGSGSKYWWGRRFQSNRLSKANGFGIVRSRQSVWEWTSTCFVYDPNEKQWMAGASGALDCQRPLRGGSARTPEESRHPGTRVVAVPSTKVFDVGFRLIRDFSGRPRF